MQLQRLDEKKNYRIEETNRMSGVVSSLSFHGQTVSVDYPTKAEMDGFTGS